MNTLSFSYSKSLENKIKEDPPLTYRLQQLPNSPSHQHRHQRDNSSGTFFVLNEFVCAKYLLRCSSAKTFHQDNSLCSRNFHDAIVSPTPWTYVVLLFSYQTDITKPRRSFVGSTTMQLLRFLPVVLAASAYAASHSKPHPAGLIPRNLKRDDAPSPPTTNHTGTILVGASGVIRAFDFNGTDFLPKSNANISEDGKTASWMVFKDPYLYAVDENSNNTRRFSYNQTTGDLSTEQASFQGSSGVVYLAFNDDKSVLVGSSYGQGQLDIWNASTSDGGLSLIKQIPLPFGSGPGGASQSQARAHQAVLDPSKRFFMINDLGADRLHLLDAGSWSIINTFQVMGAGSGPRHGAFLTLDGGRNATHYVVVCEISSTIQLFATVYTDEGNMRLDYLQTVSTFGPGLPPANATTARAGELRVSGGADPASIYVSNRLTSNQTDSISRFAVWAKSENDTTPALVFQESINTGGSAPRMFSFSRDQDQAVMYLANMNGQVALQANERCNSTITDKCVMVNKPFAKFEGTDFYPAEKSGQNFGPQFVIEV